MKKLALTVLLAGASFTLYGQTTDLQDTSYWAKSLKGIFGINQSSFSNWQAGGENSIAWNTLLELQANYDRGRTSWHNTLKMGYGSTNQKSIGLRKNDDFFNFNTKFAYKLGDAKPKLLWTTSIGVLTQFTDGYIYPNDSVKISAFLAPGYMLIDTGLEYRDGDKFSLIYSPLAAKTTFVNDDSLSNAGAYGVDVGQKLRTEMGTALKINYANEILKNVNYTGGLVLFTDYAENFGNIDVYFTNLFVFKISDIFATTLSFDFIYDDDITIQEFDEAGNVIGEGPHLQYKQVLSLGLTLNLDSRKK